MKLVLVNFFSILILFSSIFVVISKNSMYSVLFLVLSFLSASILLFLFENEFLALFFLIIYLGAIAVLFLFVIMMLNIKYNDLQRSNLYFPIGILIGFTILVEILGALKKVFVYNSSLSSFEHNLYINWYDIIDVSSDVFVLSQIFYTHYVLQILLAGLILYVAVIGVAFLTVKSAFKKTKRNQSIFRQISRKNIL